MSNYTEAEVRSIYSIKSDLFSSYNEYYAKLDVRHKRDMYYYWEGMIRAFCIAWQISEEGKKELDQYLTDVFYKKVKFLGMFKEYYTLR